MVSCSNTAKLCRWPWVGMSIYPGIRLRLFRWKLTQVTGHSSWSENRPVIMFLTHWISGDFTVHFWFGILLKNFFLQLFTEVAHDSFTCVGLGLITCCQPVMKVYKHNSLAVDGTVFLRQSELGLNPDPVPQIGKETQQSHRPMFQICLLMFCTE